MGNCYEALAIKINMFVLDIYLKYKPKTKKRGKP